MRACYESRHGLRLEVGIGMRLLALLMNVDVPEPALEMDQRI